ncbi:Oxysterol-binding protein-like protein OBPa [Suhomyces tanzawaensis NRRL Y-17324]|uniref:Oxysterol-binding protein-like protein OBPa n=1 Tax=Suhomyces tanzawaensis NRRL Y-17324 TaxID=984487 RepID=A0A1E4SQ61_9ASCO|nr:Oxysterol-binding protein-like protein OBPa [Suhomyces tanzawaensis NRRL Y-17324]ODV81638.1 Oxysterol-binding protein-like protein OBPa [Suhomyces tanzawaensis NRRL Y-17324]
MGLTSKLDKLKIRASSEELESTSSKASTPHGDQTKDTDDVDEIDNEGQSILSGIIAQLRPGCDLSKITLPTFILEKKSMLERITNFFQIPNLLLDANKTEDELERFIAVLKWYLASWHIAPKAVKKPLNPVLGEVFACYWDDLPDGNKAYYVSEQVSHHPPKSSYFYLVPELKIRVDGVVVPKSKFLGNSSAAIMEGWGHVTLGERDDEVYIMNQPNVYCRGILFGKLRLELGDHMYVKCAKTGFEADIDFKTKGFISGTYDAIEGVIKNSKNSEVLYNISGKWNEVMEIKNVKTGEKKVLFDTAGATQLKSQVKPLDEQWEYESRNLWKPTLEGLSKRDHNLATEEKFKVENEQRIIAKKRLEAGVDFHPRLFRPVSDLEQDIKDLEYIIYKHIDLSEDAESLRSSVLDIFPILPGQKLHESFDIPGYKKASGKS